MSRAKNRWIYPVLAILLGVVLAEASLDITAIAVPRVRYRLSPLWSRTYLADAALGYRASPGAPGLDRRGFRNPPGRLRCEILAVGGSFTNGRTVALEATWPQRLESLTGETSYNMSCGGYGPCESLVLLERQGLAFEPKTVLVEVHPSTAFALAYASVYTSGRFPDLRSTDPVTREEIARADRAGTLLDAADQIWWRATCGAETDPSAIVDQAFFGEGPARIRSLRAAANPIGRALAEHSSLWGLGSEAWRILGARRRHSVSPGPPASAESLDVAAGHPCRIPLSGDPRFRTLFPNPKYLRLPVDRSDPRIREGERITRVVLSAMDEKLRSLGIQLLILVAPSKALVYSHFSQGDGTRLSEDLLQVVLLEQQATNDLVSFLELRGIPAVDASEPLCGCFERAIAPYDSSDADSPSSAGYQAVAEHVAHWISGALLERARNDRPAASYVDGSSDR
jgi:hypothetical protein